MPWILFAEIKSRRNTHHHTVRFRTVVFASAKTEMQNNTLQIEASKTHGDSCVYTKRSTIEIVQNLTITVKTLEKLKDKHAIERSEVEQCFANRYGKLLIDNREQHKTNPPTLWFLAKTNKGRLLKVMYIQKGIEVHLRSTYEPNADEVGIYARRG